MNVMTLRASQTPIVYEDRGAGLALVLLHAFPLDSTMWQQQLGTLSDRFRTIVPDLPGFGGSGVSAGVTIDSMADAVAELLDHLGVNERVVIGGLSMGGYVALAFARLYPQRVLALVLADTRADPDDEAGRASRDKLIQIATDQPPAAFIEHLLPKLLGPTTADRQPDVVRYVRETAGRQRADGIVAALKALRKRPDARPGLPHLSFPTLVLVGEQDAITPINMAQVLAGGIPNARLVSIPNAGHLSSLENPTAFTSAVRGFLDSLQEAKVARTV